MFYCLPPRSPSRSRASDLDLDRGRVTSFTLLVCHLVSLFYAGHELRALLQCRVPQHAARDPTHAQGHDNRRAQGPARSSSQYQTARGTTSHLAPRRRAARSSTGHNHWHRVARRAASCRFDFDVRRRRFYRHAGFDVEAPEPPTTAIGLARPARHPSRRVRRQHVLRVVHGSHDTMLLRGDGSRRREPQPSMRLSRRVRGPRSPRLDRTRLDRHRVPPRAPASECQASMLSMQERDGSHRRAVAISPCYLDPRRVPPMRHLQQHRARVLMSRRSLSIDWNIIWHEAQRVLFFRSPFVAKHLPTTSREE